MTDNQPLVVLITGAGKGAGRRSAEAFAAQGASLALNDIAPNNLDPLLYKWKPGGCMLKAYVEDVSKGLSAQALVNQVLQDWGRIDVLINHATVEPHIPLLDMDEWDWQRTLEVNLTGAFMMIKLVGRLMRMQGSGVIINLVSLAAKTPQADRTAYLATQLGLVGLTQQASRELQAYGVRLHALGSGLGSLENTRPEVPRQLEGAVLFLAGPRAAGLTGIIAEAI